VLASARGVYQGGALYYTGMSLPHLGDFALTALLGSEPIGAPLHLRGACPEGLRPKPDGVNCGCPPGSTGGGGTGALTCTPCAAGTASTLAGGECAPCPAGRFSGEGAAHCSPCERGRFNSQLMATKCRPCPSGTYSATGATECLVCGLRDVSQRTVETADGDVGSSSPYGIDCEDGVVGAVDANPYCDLNPNPNPNPNLTPTPNPTPTPDQVGAVDANGTVTGVLPGHWAGALCLPYISPISPLYLHHISLISPATGQARPWTRPTPTSRACGRARLRRRAWVGPTRRP
jgi:hypothetical protein